MGKASTANAASFHLIIEQYCQASGQKVNLLKSSICFSPKTQRKVREAIINLSGITSQTDRLMYLGIPITGRRPRCSDFAGLERRVRQRMEGWQVTGLSMMARIIIIRSVLSSIPQYLLSNAAIPITCLRRIERLFRDFLWASMHEGHGAHLLSWDCICMPISEGGLGIQSLLVRHHALLARHASRFILEPECLWSSMMRTRYGAWSSASFFSPPRGCSFFWKEVCRYGQAISDHVSWMIGDGSSIDVIHDTWISELPLSRWPTFISIDAPALLKVKDLLSSDPLAWNVPLIRSFFGNDLSRRIISLPLIPGSLSDSRLWQRSCLAKAPSRDLIKLFRPPPQRTEDAAWIWKLPIIPRVQLFIWKLLWDCLPTCSRLSRMGLAIQPICPLCSSEEESTDHAIFSCPRARCVWNMIGHPIGQDVSGGLRSSFLSDLRTGAQQKKSLWATTAYQIWLSRNQLIFSDDAISPHKTVRKIRLLVADYARIGFDNFGLWGSPAASAASRHPVYIFWEPPPPGFVKINFDGSVRGRAAGSGFIIRGPHGDLLAAGGFGTLDSSVPMSELYAAWAGISFAVRVLQAQRLFIEGDSMSVISWLKKENCPSAASNPILGDIWSIIQEVEGIQIRHIYREANSAADWVASFVAQHAGSWSWRPGDLCPSLLQLILYSDISGLTRTRLV